MVIAIDFDGTMTTSNNFPEVGEFRPNAIEVIKRLQKYGHKCFLWTCREGEYLEQAKKAIEEQGLIMDGYNTSPYDNVNKGRKPIADLYIDDHNLGLSDINWLGIEFIILKATNPGVKIFNP